MKTLEMNEKLQKTKGVCLPNQLNLICLLPKSTKLNIKEMLIHSTLTLLLVMKNIYFEYS